jgi:hypothetical protein
MARKKIDPETTKKIKIKKEELKDLQSQLLEVQEALETDVSGEDREILSRRAETLQTKIDFCKNDLKDLGHIFQEYKNIVRKMNEDDENVLIDKISKKFDLKFWINEGKFIYCRDYSNDENIKRVKFNTVDRTKIVWLLNKLAKRIDTPCTDHFQSSVDRICDYFQINNLDVEGVTASVIDNACNDDLYNKAKVIQRYWVQPDMINYESYDRDWDLLMYCVGGGKQENIEHLEQWLAYKYWFPHRVGNIPNLDLGGAPGGNGKGRFIEIMKTIFTQDCVTEAKPKELQDGFTGSWELSFILYFDEPTEKELPNHKMKNVTGSETTIIERKGIDSYTADRMFNLVLSSNNQNGVYKLAGGGSSGEDRRISVITTDVVMVEEIMRREGCDEETAKVRTNEIAQKVKQRDWCSKVLGHLLVKYDVPNMKILKPLHGIDYNKRLEDQKSNLDNVFDQLLPVLQESKMLPMNVVTTIAKSATDNPKLQVRTVKQKFEGYLKRQRIDAIFKKQQRVRILWNGDVTDTIQTSAVYLDQNVNDFEYSTISDSIYNKDTAPRKDDCLIIE